MNRIDKVLSDLGVASRKELRQMIREGRVEIDGQRILTPEYRFDPEMCEIRLDGRVLAYKKFRYFAMDKPAGVLTASEDKKQKTVIDLLPQDLRGIGLFAVGRLDKDTSGLLLLTNDGEFAHRVLSPRHDVKKRYFAKTAGSVTEADVRAFAAGVELKDGTCCLPALLEPAEEDMCFVTVREGKYHQVRRMLAAVGKPVLELRRVSIGDLKLEELMFADSVCELLPHHLSKIIR